MDKMTGLVAEHGVPAPARQISRASTSTGEMAHGADDSVGSPGSSGDESPGGLSPEEQVSPPESVLSSARGLVKEESENSPVAQHAQTESANMPVQKRRRVTRACDECRRKKIKCDGKHPCTHCSVYSYECTYDKPSNRRRNPAPQYIEALEARLQRAEELLHEFMPDVDLTDPNLDPAVQQEFRSRGQTRAKAASLTKDVVVAKEETEQPPAKTKEVDKQDAQIMSMIETIGALDLEEGGEWNFHGISSSIVFLRRMKEHFAGLLGDDYRIPFFPRAPRPPGMFRLDSPSKTNASSQWDLADLPDIYDLPTEERARTLCYYSFNCATCLLRIVHTPSFYDMLSKLYRRPRKTWSSEEHRFLGLLYAVMALGCMYNIPADDPSTPRKNYKAALDEGIKYYASARIAIQDMAECRDMTSLQALLFMILFLQASSNLNGCYAFVGIALRSALRMGLHRHLPHAKVTPIEDETRRRVFHVIRQIDTYVSAILGFPILLHDEDVDQPMPTEVDDEYITKDAIITPPPGTPSFFQAFNAQDRLMKIMYKVVKNVYPVKGVEECVVMNGERQNHTYMISFAQIKEIERDLHEWYEELPQYWRPGPDGPIEVTRVRTLLRFGYAQVQMMLYRPFLHYVSPRSTAGKNIDERYYACAAAAISVSRNIIHIGMEIQKQAVLIGSYWFILYSAFFGVMSLVYYVLENPEKDGSAEILEDARAGKEFLANLSMRSVAAERVSNTLNSLFEQLPEHLKNNNSQSGGSSRSRKRTFQGPKATTATPAPAHPLPHGTQVAASRKRSSESINAEKGIVSVEAQGLSRSASFDEPKLQRSSIPGHDSAVNLQEFLPFDLPVSGSVSESGSAAGRGGIRNFSQAFQQVPTTAMSTNPLYELDVMMFPSEDPFAYPNQPMVVDSAVQNAGHRGQSPYTEMSRQQQDAPFYTYDDIEGQLLGPVPAYLVQQGPIQQGYEFTADAYSTLSMAAFQRARSAHPQHGPHQRPPREIDEVMSEPNFRGNWGGLFGNSDYRQL